MAQLFFFDFDQTIARKVCTLNVKNVYNYFPLGAVQPLWEQYLTLTVDKSIGDNVSRLSL